MKCLYLFIMLAVLTKTGLCQDTLILGNKTIIFNNPFPLVNAMKASLNSKDFTEYFPEGTIKKLAFYMDSCDIDCINKSLPLINNTQLRVYTPKKLVEFDASVLNAGEISNYFISLVNDTSVINKEIEKTKSQIRNKSGEPKGDMIRPIIVSDTVISNSKAYFISLIKITSKDESLVESKFLQLQLFTIVNSRILLVLYQKKTIDIYEDILKLHKDASLIFEAFR